MTRASLVAILALAMLAGCGSDDPEGPLLPRGISAELEKQIGSVENRVGARNPGACADISRENLPAIETQLDAIPDDVDGDVRDATIDGFRRLGELVADECSSIEDEADTDTAPEETVTEEPETETTIETETVAPETETEVVPPETDPPVQTTPQDDAGGGTEVPGGDSGGAGAPPGSGD